MNHRNLLPLFALLYTTAGANNIQVSAGTLTAINTGQGHAAVRFSVQWENSWRTSSAPNNWDAAWVFVKYKDNTGEWHHARLGSDAQHIAPAGATIATGLLTPGTPYDAATNWGVGAFVHRSADGTGTFAANGVELRWNYGDQGITYGDIAKVQVFAIEMVYVPQGSFYVGSGGNEDYHFKDGTTNDPFQITGEGAINMANANGSLWASGGTYIEAATLPAAFPKGWAGFYCMKTEVAQQDYTDFLNTLTRMQQDARTNIAAGQHYVMTGWWTVSYRNGIWCEHLIPTNDPVTFYCNMNRYIPGGESDDGQWVSCNWLSWADLAAYLDWSGLRPMTELEYEKACRGGQAPVADEFAWGDTIATDVGWETNSGAVNEGCILPGNCVCNGAANGPMRVGVVATSSATRAQAGAGYYGALDLSGNVEERPVTVGNADGRAFTGVHGDGALDAGGGHDAPAWPAITGSGAGQRGGGWHSTPTEVCVSRRSFAASIDPGRRFHNGGRGVRSLP